MDTDDLKPLEPLDDLDALADAGADDDSDSAPGLEPAFKAFELRAAPGDGDEPIYEFIASDATPDRYGDTIRVSGWDLKAYKRNPVILADHDATKAIGIAQVWKDADALRVRIRLAEPGTNADADEQRELLRQGIKRAVSVGFMPKEAPRRREDDDGQFLGFEWRKQELLEISVVAIPANPNALRVKTLKSMGFDDEAIARMLPSAGDPAEPTRDPLATRRLELRQLSVQPLRLRARGPANQSESQ